MTARPPETELDVSARTAFGIFLALGAVFFFPAFLPGQGIFGTDYLAGSYQFMEFLSNQLRAGEIPKWVPYVYGGVPLHANPGSTYYPTRLALMWALPDSRVFPALLMSQLIIGGSGMYLLARELGARTWISFLAGLAFMFTGITMSGLYSGHDGRIIVATFAPLAFFFIHQGMRTGALSSFAGLAATLGFTLLSFQIQSNYYLLLGGAFWTLFCAWQFREAGKLQVARRMTHALLAVGFAFALSAVNFLPFLDYVAESPRGAEGGRGYEYSTSFSMPPAETIGLAIPEQQGVLGTYHGKSFFKQHTEYVGALVIAMLLLGFVFARRSRYWIFFAITTVVALSMSYGGYTPIYRIYYSLLPGVDKFRAPSISLFMVSMSLVVMAALTLEALARIREQALDASRTARRTGRTAGKERTDIELAAMSALVLSGIGLFLLFVSQVIPEEVNESTGWLRFGLFLGVTSILIWTWLSEKLPSRILALALCVVTLVDMWVVTRQFFQIVPPPEEVFAPDDVVQYLRAERDSSRVWVFPFGGQAVYRGMEQVGDNRIPLRNYLMHFGIEQAGGEHGNQLDRWNKYAGAGEKVYVDWHNFLNNAHFRSAANVRYIISGVDLGIPAGDSASIHMEEVYRGSAIIYRNNLVLPRAYLVPRVAVIADTDSALAFMNSPLWDPREVAVIDRPAGVAMPEGPLQQAAVITERKPDRVVVRTNANRPALLVLSDVYAHGWKAYVDDRLTPIVITNVAFRGVPVDAGEHTVRFVFDPDELETGRIISAVLALLLIGYGIWYLVSARRKPREEEEPA